MFCIFLAYFAYVLLAQSCWSPSKACLVQWLVASDWSLLSFASLHGCSGSSSGNPIPVTSRGCFGISHRYPMAGSYLSWYHEYSILWQGKLSMRYHFFQKISWDNFPYQMTTKISQKYLFESYLCDIYEIAHVCSRYQWSTHSIPEIPTVYQWYVPGISYRAVRIHAVHQWPSPGISHAAFGIGSADCSPQLNPPAKIQHSVADGSSSTTQFTTSFSCPWGQRLHQPSRQAAKVASHARMGGSWTGESTGAGASSATLGTGGSRCWSGLGFPWPLALLTFLMSSE